jgi:hypothetical protein
MADFKDNLIKENTPILESDLSAIEKVSKIAHIIREGFEADETQVLTKELVSYLTEMGRTFTDLIRESAWGSSTPIKFKDALEKGGIDTDMYTDENWDMFESWIDHDRDYNWKYLLVTTHNLSNNKLSDKSGFWLSPQHFRLLAILNTVGNEMSDNDFEAGHELNLAKSLYNSADQFPQAIRKTVKTLRHSA